MVYVRYLAAWAVTLAYSTAASAAAILFPQWSWLTFARPWGQKTLQTLQIRWLVLQPQYRVGPAVFVSNHQSLLDDVVLPAVLPRTTRFLAKKELWRVPFWGWALGRAGAIMIDRRDSRGARAAIRRGLKRLPRGWSVLVFPEGTRSHDGNLLPFKKGAFHIAIERGLPIIPIGIDGTRECVPKGKTLPRPGIICVAFGAPISTDGWQRDNLSDHIQQVREVVSELTVQAQQARLNERSVRNLGDTPPGMLHSSR